MGGVCGSAKSTDVKETHIEKKGNKSKEEEKEVNGKEGEGKIEEIEKIEEILPFKGEESKEKEVPIAGINHLTQPGGKYDSLPSTNVGSIGLGDVTAHDSRVKFVQNLAKLHKLGDNIQTTANTVYATENTSSGSPSKSPFKSPSRGGVFFGGGNADKTWRKGELIEKGMLGSTYQGLDLRTGQLIAIKLIKTSMVSNDSTPDIRSLSKNLQKLGALKHPNLVKYYSLEYTNQENDSELNILHEYVTGGSLLTIIEKFGALQEKLVRIYIGQILRGLEFIHSLGLVHRNLKCSNVLIDNSAIVKISDFALSKNLFDYGLKKLLKEGEIKDLLKRDVFPFWLAPEVVTSGEYTASSDVWSLGIMIIQLLTGKVPWASQFRNAADLFEELAIEDCLPEYPENISEVCESFLDLCLTYSHEDRPSMAQLKTHPFSLTEEMDEASSKQLSEIMSSLAFTSGNRFRQRLSAVVVPIPWVKQGSVHSVNSIQLENLSCKSMGEEANIQITDQEEDVLDSSQMETNSPIVVTKQTPNMLHTSIVTSNSCDSEDMARFTSEMDSQCASEERDEMGNDHRKQVELELLKELENKARNNHRKSYMFLGVTHPV